MKARRCTEETGHKGIVHLATPRGHEASGRRHSVPVRPPYSPSKWASTTHDHFERLGPRSYVAVLFLHHRFSAFHACGWVDAPRAVLFWVFKNSHQEERRQGAKDPTCRAFWERENQARVKPPVLARGSGPAREQQT